MNANGHTNGNGHNHGCSGARKATPIDTINAWIDRLQHQLRSISEVCGKLENGTIVPEMRILFNGLRQGLEIANVIVDANKQNLNPTSTWMPPNIVAAIELQLNVFATAEKAATDALAASLPTLDDVLDREDQQDKPLYQVLDELQEERL